MSKCNYNDNSIALPCDAGFTFCCALTLTTQGLPPEFLLFQDTNLLNGKSKEH